MTTGSIVLETSDTIDERTAHALAAAQLKGESRAKGRAPRQVVESIAREIRGIGLRPNLTELSRRYQAGAPRLPEWIEDAPATRAG